MATKNLTAGLASAIALFVSASAASAATVENKYCFAYSSYCAGTPSISNAASATFTGSSGLQVGVTGTTYSNSGGSFVAGSAIDVENNSYGLISNNYGDGLSDKGETHQHALDSYYADEAFVFDFGRQVSLTELVFGWAAKSKDNRTFYSGGWFELFVDGASAGIFGANSAFAAVTGQVFSIGATNGGYLNKYYSHLKLKKMTVTYDDTPTVPLPAGAILMLTALGGLGIARKRKA